MIHKCNNHQCWKKAKKQAVTTIRDNGGEMSVYSLAAERSWDVVFTRDVLTDLTMNNVVACDDDIIRLRTNNYDE